MKISYWLMKSEPDVYGIQHLQQEGTTLWDGIRNYQARNFMRSMSIGDQAFFYHSNAKPPGIVGMMEVIETRITDPSQFDSESKYFDPKSKPEVPRWDCVRLKYVGTFGSLLSLDALRQNFSVEELPVIRQGNRLSILPIPEASAERLLALLGPL